MSKIVQIIVLKIVSFVKNNYKYYLIRSQNNLRSYIVITLYKLLRGDKI